MDVLEILLPFGRLNDNCILDNNRTMKIAIIGAGNMGGAKESGDRNEDCGGINFAVFL